MGTNKLIEKLEDFFGLSEKKQQKKREKLLKIIRKLEEKKIALEQDVVEESEIDETSARYHELNHQLKVLSKLIKKAKKQEAQLDHE